MADQDPAPAPDAPAAASSDAIQESPFSTLPSAPGTSKSAVPGKKRLTPARVAAEMACLDRVLVLLVLVFAFLVASFAARNSDLWMHLATGRALAHGEYTFGVDPFAHTTSNVYWTNHNWLYDLIFYNLARLSGGAETLLGGAVLIGLKAMLVTVLAWVLLAIRRREQSVWVPAVCTALAILTMSPRLLLQPLCVSYLFVGLTLYILAREGKRQQTAEIRGWRVLFTSAPARLYVLPFLFLLWSNLDTWFVLGPTMVALHLFGTWLQQKFRPVTTGQDVPDPAEMRRLAMVLALGVAACCLNPHHFHVFALPPELFPSLQFATLKDVGGFKPFFYTPFQNEYYTSVNLGGNVAGWSFWMLLLLGSFSFMLNAGGLRVWRFVMWLAFALLSASNVRLIPFFAIVAGPITALNLQDCAARHFGIALPVSDRARFWSLSGRFLTVLAMVALIVTSWPGWLQPDANNPVLARRAAWNVVAEPSLKKAAEQLRQWRANGSLSPQSRGFNINPDMANYCAWFCPEEKSFFDFRYGLFSEALPDYLAVRRVLRGEDKTPRDPNAEPLWHRVFRDRGIDHVILSGPDLMGTARLLMTNPQEWTTLYMDGRTTIFGWRDPATTPTDPLAKLELNLVPRAFDAGAERAPGEGPGRTPERWDWWQGFWRAPAPRSLDSDEAIMDLLYYDAHAALLQRARLRAWVHANLAACVAMAGQSAGYIATPSAFTAEFATVHGSALSDWMAGQYAGTGDRGPPAAPVLALRAARRGLVANPDDPNGYANLAKVIHVLWRSQENYWARLAGPPRIFPPQIGQIRQVIAQRRQPVDPYLSPWVSRNVTPRQLLRQVTLVWAFQQVLAVRPDQEAHQALAVTYWQMGYYDLSLEHFREALKLYRAAGPQPGQSRKDFDQELAGLDKLLQGFETEVKELRNAFALVAAGQPLGTKAVRAFYPFGLVKESLTLLQEDVKQLTVEEADLYIYLLLTTGQLDKLRGDSSQRLGLLEKELKNRLPSQYDIYQAILAAAVGDYKQAGQSLESVLASTPKPVGMPLLLALQGATFDYLMTPSIARLFLMPTNVQFYFLQGREVLMNNLAQESELQALRGLVALEEGDVDTATKHFRKSLNPAGPPVNFESRPIAIRYLELLGDKPLARP
ncbi:MAG: tetratricopeptide repeat protein [Gemmataceae bacterium]|nr:tetratricopeptide repeat protein [Gemmataceae bacterium]